MNRRKDKSLVFVGCVEAGFFTASRLICNGIHPSAIVCIDHETANRACVSGYCDLFLLDTPAERYRPASYSLKDPADREFFLSRRFDLLVVMGWQRMIPQEIIDSLRVCGLTIHGSGEGLPRGRGRSPMNWAILEGHEQFYLSLLTLSPEADGGLILGTRVFDILPVDNIRTLYYKNAYFASLLLLEQIPEILEKGVRGSEQDESRATYYPKRSPEDGRIDWASGVEDIERLVRATARPYPGAFTTGREGFIRIWEARHFDRHAGGDEGPGTVAAVFPDGAFLVKAADGHLLVLDYEGVCPGEGEVLE